MHPDAREQYRLGLEFYDGRDYEQALEKFQASFGLFPSPNSELYVARCLRYIGKTKEAIEAYERAIKLAGELAKTNPKYSDTLQAARQELAVLKPPPPPTQRFVPGIWTSTGIGVAGFVSFGAFSLVARSKYQTLERQCEPLPCPASQTGAVETGRNYQLAANLSLAVGVAGAVTAVTLYVLGRPRVPAWGKVAIVGSTLQLSGAF